MGKRVYGLKHATGLMKIQHMNRVMEFKASLKESQNNYIEPMCANPQCGKKQGSLPMYLVGKTDLCFGCYEDQRDEKKAREQLYDHIDNLQGQETARPQDIIDLVDSLTTPTN